MITSNAIHKDLLVAIDLMYNKCAFICTPPRAESESADYGAYTLGIGRKSVKYRVAKITPTKTGQFLTLWKRRENGPIE